MNFLKAIDSLISTLVIANSPKGLGGNKGGTVKIRSIHRSGVYLYPVLVLKRDVSTEIGNIYQ